MSYDGLRDWLVQVDAMNELRTLEGIDWNLEMGAVVDVLYREHPPYPPALVFDKIKDHAAGFRALFGHFASPKRIALTLGITEELRPCTRVRESLPRKNEALLCRFRWRKCKTGEVHENVQEGDRVNLLRFSRASAPRKRWRPLHRHGSSGDHQRKFSRGCGDQPPAEEDRP